MYLMIGYTMFALKREQKATDLNENIVNKIMHTMTCLGTWVLIN